MDRVVQCQQLFSCKLFLYIGTESSKSNNTISALDSIIVRSICFWLAGTHSQLLVNMSISRLSFQNEQCGEYTKSTQACGEQCHSLNAVRDKKVARAPNINATNCCRKLNSIIGWAPGILFTAMAAAHG